MAKSKVNVDELPDWDEFPKLRKMGADKLLERAVKLQAQIKTAEAELKEMRPMLAAKLKAAGAERVAYEGVAFLYKNGYDRRTFDNDWAKKTLVAKGVSTTEIEKHYKVTPVNPTVEIGVAED